MKLPQGCLNDYAWSKLSVPWSLRPGHGSSIIAPLQMEALLFTFLPQMVKGKISVSVWVSFFVVDLMHNVSQAQTALEF
jgi:hypothetical protein